jgi:threonine/homoserine/homoserine lactone efflux protein
MSVLDFGIEVIVLSASGVLAPGPLFFANLVYGTRLDKWSGIKVASGHTVVELPLIIILAAGLSTFDAAIKYAGIIGLIGGIAILAFAALQIASIIVKEKPAHDTRHMAGIKGPFVVGVALTALNPFFLLWWFTVGLKLISDSAAFGVSTGVIILFALHIWMDYAWLGGTAYLASKGAFLLESKYYWLLLLGLAAVLMYYGISFVLQAAYQQIYQ